MTNTLLSLALAGAVGLASVGCKDKFTLKGELIKDYVHKMQPEGNVYRIVVQNSEGIVTYPVIGDSAELARLERYFVSREDNGVKGDSIAINPESVIFSLDEVILLPENIKKIRQQK